MEDILKQFVGKISSYDFFNNLYPGFIFCYLLKYMFNTNILLDNWIENLLLFYFFGMVLSRVGSVFVEPLLKTIKFKKQKLLKTVLYSDYVNASAEDSLISTLSETNNTYRSLISCFTCAFLYKTYLTVNENLIQVKCTFFQDNEDWIILVFLILLFVCSYVKQTNYVRKRVETIKEKLDSNK